MVQIISVMLWKQSLNDVCFVSAPRCAFLRVIYNMAASSLFNFGAQIKAFAAYWHIFLVKQCLR